MGLFCKRPLALCCFVFLISSLLAWFISNSLKIVIVVVAAIIALGVFLISFRFKRTKMRVLTLCICVISLLTAFCHSYIFIGIPNDNAKKYIGENRVLCYIIDRESTTEESEVFTVKIKNVEGETTNIRAVLSCDFTTDLNAGDEIYGIGEISENKNHMGEERECLLNVYMRDKSKCYGRYTSTQKNTIGLLFSECGIEIISEKLSDRIKDVLFSLLGEEKGALAMGFFTGERSDMPAYITRDFRRAGVSHIMAVSGSHIAILLGSIEMLLRKLGVAKSVRCVIISIFSIAFLFITAFSLSGCRSVLMLYAVYISYLTYEDNDPITSLFSSITAIVLIFPFAIIDLGLWMSFLATLGLLTVFPILEEKIPYPRIKKKILNQVLIAGRYILITALMTVTANMLLLPIIWYFFGELSIVSVLSNIAITHLSGLFLISIPMLLIFHKIPLIGAVLKWGVMIIADIIIYIVELFSRIPNATVSLKYSFCGIIMVLFAVSLSIMMIIRLKRKIIITAPYFIAVTILITGSILCGEIFTSPTLSYSRLRGDDELIVVSEGNKVSFCDNTSGNMNSYYKMKNALKQSNATEINKYVLTHYHKGSANTFDMLTQNEIVRTLYLPMPKDNDEIKYSRNLWDIACDRNIDVVFYQDKEVISLSKNVIMGTVRSDVHEKGRTIVFSTGEDYISYITPAFYNSDVEYKKVILGCHGVDGDRVYDMKDIKADEVYISSKRLRDKIDINKGENIYITKYDKAEYQITFELIK